MTDPQPLTPKPFPDISAEDLADTPESVDPTEATSASPDADVAEPVSDFPSTSATTDDVSPTPSTTSSELPADEADSPFVSDPGATDTASVTTESAGTDAAGSEPESQPETPIYDATVSEAGADPSSSLDTSGTTSSDSSTSPSSASTPESPATTSPVDDEPQPYYTPAGEDELADEPTPDATPANSAGEADPTGTGTVIGKDGAGPTETQPSLGLDQPDGSTLNTGPGVPADVSLSPTAAGGYTSDPEQEAPSIDPTYVEPPEPVEEPEPVRSFGTPIDPTFEAATTGYTPRFRGTLRPNGVIEVQRSDWIGPEVLTVDVDEVDEITGLLKGLAAKKD